MADTNGTATSENGTVNRVPTDETVKPKGKGKPKGMSKAERLDALFRKANGLAVTVSGNDGQGTKYTVKADGFPEDTSVEGTADHFRVYESKTSRSKAVGTGKVAGKGENEADDAAEIVELILS